jgi:heptosyltransferase-2
MRLPPLLFSVRIPTLLAIFWRKQLGRNTRPAKPPATPGSIIIFRLDQLGDLVLTTPLFRELKRLYPNSRCTVVVQPGYRAILTTNHNVDEILLLHQVRAKWLPTRLKCVVSALWFFAKHLRHRHFDMVISPRWGVDESLATMLCVLTKAGRRVGYSERESPEKRQINGGFDAAFDLLVPPGPLQHEVDHNLAIVEALGGGTVGDRRLELQLTPNDRQAASELLRQHEQGQSLVAIGIGARAASRKWPLQRYAECIARLNQLQRVQPVIVCSGEEEDDASALSAMLPVPSYILSGLPLRVSCAVLQRCDLFLGNDSGAAHLAAAVDCPTIVVSRHPKGGDPTHANSPVRFAPYCSRYRVVQPPHAAPECELACQASAPHCINLVTTDMVVAAALDLVRDPVGLTNTYETQCRKNVTTATHIANDEALLEAANAQ